MKRLTALVLALLMMLTSLPISSMTFAEDTYTDLVISEYVEGSSSNKAIEIFNGTSQTVDLSEYKLELYYNGKTEVGKEQVLAVGDTLTLASGEVIVIAKSSASQAILDQANYTSTTIDFNGNDLLVLKHNDTIIDSFGQFENSSNYAKDVTYRRLTSNKIGDTDITNKWVSDAYELFTKDSFDDLGQYNGNVNTSDPVDPDPVDPDPVNPIDALNPLDPDFSLEDYYATANGLTGDALKAALNDVIDNHTELSYSEAYNALITTDKYEGPIYKQDYDASQASNVVLFYTGLAMDGPAKYADTQGWNREHTWAKSHGNFGEDPGPGTDLHQLRPTDVEVNSARGHLDFDESDNAYDAYGNFVDGDSWEPRDEVKGDVARILFYMATRYEGEHSEVDLELSESLDSYGETKEGYGEHGKLSTLLQWHIDDPVSDFERARNNVVYFDFQGNRNPFIDHPEYVAMIFGGDTVDPVDPEIPDGLKIYDIQGQSHESPYVSQNVENVVGVVTSVLHYKFDSYGSYINGFYMQDPTGDDNNQTSDAIFVRLDAEASVVPGDLVSVNGQVIDYVKQMDFYAYDLDNQLSVTAIKASNVSVLSQGNPLPAPVVLGQNGRVVPHDLIASANFESYDADLYAADFYESLEGMRVQINDPLVVSAYINRVVGVVPDNGAIASSENDLSILNSVILEKDDVNTEVLLINGAIKPVTSARYIKMGATFNDSLVGVLDYEWGNYQLYITEDLPSYSNADHSDQSFKYETSDTDLTIASYNVYNHSADDSQSKTDGIAKQIVNQMKSPDIIGLCEVQDNNGKSGNNVTDATLTYEGFINAIKAQGGPSYEWIDIEPVYNAEGGETNGNIRVGFLYNPLRVTLVDGIKGGSTESNTVDAEGHLTLNPGRIAATEPAFDGTRKSLAAEFEFNGENIIVIMDHLKSKGGDNGIYGNVQPPVLHSEAKRVEQAALVNAFVDDILANNADANVVVMGDMNDFQFSQPLQALKGDVLTNMVDLLPKAERFSYTYNGNAQVLDHILVTNNLVSNTQADILNINTMFGKEDYANKHSDHDPIMVKISGLEGEPPAVYPVIASANGEVEENAEITLSSRTEGVTIYYAIDQDLDLETLENNQLYTGPIVVDKAMMLQVVAVKGEDVSAVKKYEYRLALPVSTVSEARAMEKGSQVAVEVQVLSPIGVLGYNDFFFADQTAGGFVHSTAAFSGFEVGSTVRLEGTTDEYNNLFQLKVSKVKVIAGPSSLDAKEIQASDFGENYESQLVQIKDITIKEITSDNYKNQWLTLEKDGVTINGKLDSRHMEADFTTMFTVGDEVTVEGCVYQLGDKYQLIFSSPDAIKKIDVMTVAEARALPLGSEVTLSVVATSPLSIMGNKTYFFQDHTAGGYVYNKDDIEGFEVGSRLIIEGKTSDFNGLFQISVSSVAVEETVTVQPKAIEVSEFNENVQAQFVLLKDMTVKEISSDQYDNQLLTLEKDGTSIKAKLDSRNMTADFTQILAVEDVITIQGLVHEYNDSFTLILRSPEDIIKDHVVTVAEARALAKGSEVTLNVVATSPLSILGNKTYFFQDETGGGYVYNKDDIAGFEVGSKLVIKGETDIYNGLFQIKVSNVTVEETVEIQPKLIEVTDFNEDVQAQFVLLEDMIVKEISSDKFNNQYLTLEKDGTSIKVKLDSRNKQADFTQILAVEDVIAIQGLVHQYNDKFTLVLRSPEDIMKPEILTIAEAKALIGSDEPVIVEGIVTVKPGTFGNKSFVIQDETAGTYIYTKSLDQTLELGTKVRLTGIPTEYNNLFQMKDFTVEIIGTGEIEPQVITVDQIAEAVESELVRINAVEIIEINKDKYDNAYVTFKTEDGVIKGKLDSRSGSDYNDLALIASSGLRFDVLATVYQSKDTYSLSIRQASDVIALENPTLNNIHVTTLDHQVTTSIKQNTFITANAEISSDFDIEGLLIFKVVKNNKVYRLGMVANAAANDGVYSVGFDTFGMKKGNYAVKVYYWNDLENMKALSEVGFCTFTIE